MRLLVKKMFFILLVFGGYYSNAQAVIEPTYHTVYPYLSRLAQKGIIELDDVILPLTKDYIYNKLDEVSQKITKLTPLERDELAFYLKEYTLWWRVDPKSGFEGTYTSFLKSSIGDRFRTYAYQDKVFSLNVQPILGFQGESRDGFSFTRTTKGFWVYGAIGRNLGFSIDFRSNSETGRLGDYQRLFTPETGVIGSKPNFKSFDYNEMNSALTASWKWGSAMLGKNYLQIGYGQGGKILLSDKAPSFPQIRLDIKPVKWLDFNYTHAWLNSMLADSSTIRTTSIPGTYQYSFRNKYMAVHSVNVKPFKGVSILAGESAIYSDQIQLAYLIPISLFSPMSHYLGELKNNSISNSQVFAQLSLRNVLPKTHIYGSFFIDELRLREIDGDSASSRNHTAYQLGLSVADFPLKNISIVAEYSRIRPFAYVHFIPALTYQSNDYNLGHWIGPNADQFYTELLYRIKRGLEVKVKYDYVRKGSVGDGYQQVHDNKYLYPFLWGDVNYYSNFNIELKHELIHDLFIRLGYNHQQIENEKTAIINVQDRTFFGINFGF